MNQFGDLSTPLSPGLEWFPDGPQTSSCSAAERKEKLTARVFVYPARHVVTFLAHSSSLIKESQNLRTHD